MNKQTDYLELEKQMDALLTGENDLIANLSNGSALLKESLDQINWAGFYLIKEQDGKRQLVLGPFQGKPACVRIPVGKGVCGTAVKENMTLLVKNVHEFPGHIACDSASLSEIVIPIRNQGEIIGVLDIDSPVLNRFSEEDKEGLEKIAAVIESHCF
ncbi:MAG: GAF domain-containing protein [Lachnospiraceae bacterium]|jgi:L-methionine (R)-S-oxide reductase